MPEPPLQHKSIVIIGGTSGIGLSAALACRRAGALLTIVGLDDPAADHARGRLGEQVPLLTADAADPATADRAIARALEIHGRFDALYHVAGGSGRSRGDGPLHELTDEGLEHTLRLNLHALIYSNRAAARALLDRRRPGAVLNITSVLAYAPAPRHFATHAYTAAKAAVIGLTRAAAACYAPQNIRFNALAPALTDTPMARRAAADPDIMRYIASKQPLDGGRIGRPDDLDAAAVFLLSDAARFITGQVLAVDGAWSLTDGQYTDPSRKSTQG